VAPAAEEETALPTFAELEAEGARIGEIRIDPQDMFDLEDPRENKSFYRFANKLHINTRPEVIRNALLFKSGDRVSVQVIEETERLLRSNDYLYDVRIRPIAVRDRLVDIEVKTRDTWSLDLGVSASRAGGHNTGRLSIQEENLLGTVDRSGVTFEFGDNNIMGTRAAASYSYSKNDDGDNHALYAARPFYALDTRWAAGTSIIDSDAIDALYNAGNNVAEYRHKRQAVEVFGGWSPGLSGGWTRRYSIGLTYEIDDYDLEPGKPPPVRLPADLELVGPFLRFELIEDAFRKDVNLNLIGRIEDFPMGVQSRLQVGRAVHALGSTRDAWVYSASVSNGFDLTRDSFVLTEIRAGGRYAHAGENQSLGVSARYYNRQGRHLVYYAAASADAMHNPDIPGPLLIGGDNGLRGYPLRYQAGERRALFTAEARAYTDWYPLRLFRVGGAVFADVGRAWEGENQNTVNPGWLRDIGFGLRLLSARTSKGNVLHADFAFPLDPDPSIKKAQFLVKTRVSF
jgi:outer membrane protein assembly factor BamA